MLKGYSINLEFKKFSTISLFDSMVKIYISKFFFFRYEINDFKGYK